MKTIVAVALSVLFLFVVFIQWRAYRAAMAPASGSSSQIYIHGTPVCVIRQGESIVARVGECGAGAESRDEAPAESMPNGGAPGLALPPGHPPLGPDMFPDRGQRPILI